MLAEIRVFGRSRGSFLHCLPAQEGVGIIAGGAVRAVLEAAGVKNVVSKCLRSHNPHNLVKAAINGLMSLRTPEDIAIARGKTTKEILT